MGCSDIDTNVGGESCTKNFVQTTQIINLWDLDRDWRINIRMVSK